MADRLLVWLQVFTYFFVAWAVVYVLLFATWLVAYWVERR